MLAFDTEVDRPAVLFGHVGTHVFGSDIRPWLDWIERWPQLRLVVARRSWVRDGLVVGLYNNETWACRPSAA